MDQDIQKKFEEQSEQLHAIYTSVEKTRKYFLVVIWISVFAILFPLIGLFFILPSFLDSSLSSFQGLL